MALELNSAIYEGTIRHRRFQPVKNSFEYPLFLVYLDLAEIDQVLGPKHAIGPCGLVRFCRRDHLGDPNSDLEDSVRQLVLERTGTSVDGPIRLLTHLRYAGYCFNPVSFYYCYNRAATKVDVLVAEVNNTPWHEQHCYVLDNRNQPARSGWHFHSFPKIFHVSPFFDLTIDYEWHFREPGDGINFHMIDLDRSSGEKLFDATLKLKKQPFTRRNLLRKMLQFPIMTARVVALIHWQALKLWWKGAPFFAHPATRQPPTEVYHVHNKG